MQREALIGKLFSKKYSSKEEIGDKNIHNYCSIKTI